MKPQALLKYDKFSPSDSYKFEQIIGEKFNATSLPFHNKVTNECLILINPLCKMTGLGKEPFRKKSALYTQLTK